MTNGDGDGEHDEAAGGHHHQLDPAELPAGHVADHAEQRTIAPAIGERAEPRAADSRGPPSGVAPVLTACRCAADRRRGLDAVEDVVDEVDACARRGARPPA